MQMLCELRISVLIWAHAIVYVQLSLAHRRLVALKTFLTHRRDFARSKVGERACSSITVLENDQPCCSGSIAGILGGQSHLEHRHSLSHGPGEISLHPAA